MTHNPFRDPTMRKEYEVALTAFSSKHRVLFLSNGERRTQGIYGSSYASYFWKGFDGVDMRWDPASKRTIGYALYVAGRNSK